MFQKVERIIFFIIFWSILLIPLLFINRKEGVISETENRVLASPAKLYLNNGEINEKYIQDVEKWFNDNLGFRDLMGKMDGAVQYYVFRQINEMPLGSNGELAPYSKLDDYQHKNLLTDEEIDDIVQSYQTINNYLESQGIQVYYMQCWDKHSIYPEQYPDTIQVFGDISRTDQIENALIKDSGMRVIPIKDKLIAAKEEYSVYGTWAEPWHWVERGAFIGYSELINAINQNNNNKYRVLTEDDFDISQADVGQTYYGIHEADVEECFDIIEPKAKRMPEELVYIPEGGTAGHSEYYVNNAVNNEDTLLILGDSYFHDYGVCANLAESFHTTIMFNASGAQGDHLLKIIDTYEPDIVIFESAERVYRFGEVIETANLIGSLNYKNGERILFYSDESDAEKYIISGFSEKEDGFTWTEGKSACLFIYADGIEAGSITQTIFELSKVFNESQEVVVTVNGIEVFADTIRDGENIHFDFEMPESQMITMKLEFPNACSPFELGLNTDTRQLALQVQSLILKTE